MATFAVEPSLLVASVLGRTAGHLEQALHRLIEQLGALLFVSEELPFAWTRYYSDELGPAPLRRIVAARELVDPGELPRIKRATCRLEVALAERGGLRCVNVDPGLLNADQLVVASTKPRGHRVYAGQGIYVDLMLLFEGEGFAPLPWTYPDYADEALRRIFDGLRTLYLECRGPGLAAEAAPHRRQACTR